MKCPRCGSPVWRRREVKVSTWQSPGHENGLISFKCGLTLTDPTTKPFLVKPLSWMKPEHSEGAGTWACRRIAEMLPVVKAAEAFRETQKDHINSALAAADNLDEAVDIYRGETNA